jgi:hypothetical protein
VKSDVQAAFALTDQEVTGLAKVAVDYLFNTRKYEEWRSGAAPGAIADIAQARAICCRIAAARDAEGAPGQPLHRWIEKVAEWNWLTEAEKARWLP